MESQVRWGIAFIILGTCIAPFGFPFLLVYAVPLIGIGIALIVLRRREGRIEEVREEEKR
ncbi:MAG: hypothetical protein RQ758_05340 [Methanomicrobiaceae archaeon]|nr:hypothetical protein [Methanomicrobiaceae archaeon]